DALQHVLGDGGDGGRGAGDQLGAGDGAGAGERRPGDAAVDGVGVDGAGVPAEPGGQHGDVVLRAGGGVRVPGAGGPVRELAAAAGGDPGGADVPLVLGGRAAAGGHGGDDLHADRLRGAGGAGEQERHPDRGVRQ